MTEDIGDLVSTLDSLETSKGPEKVTCQWWRQQPPEVHEAVSRNVARVGHTIVTRKLRESGARVTNPDVLIHAQGKCPKCP